MGVLSRSSCLTASSLADGSGLSSSSDGNFVDVAFGEADVFRGARDGFGAGGMMARFDVRCQIGSDDNATERGIRRLNATV